MKVREFKKMNKNRKNGLRREYKLRYTDEYKTSIRLFVLYVFIGVFCLISLLYAFKFNFSWGMISFGFFFLLLIISLIILYRSNKPFYEFLDNLDRNI